MCPNKGYRHDDPGHYSTRLYGLVRVYWYMLKLSVWDLRIWYDLYMSVTVWYGFQKIIPLQSVCISFSSFWYYSPSSLLPNRGSGLLFQFLPELLSVCTSLLLLFCSLGLNVFCCCGNFLIRSLLYDGKNFLSHVRYSGILFFSLLGKLVSSYLVQMFGLIDLCHLVTCLNIFR